MTLDQFLEEFKAIAPEYFPAKPPTGTNTIRGDFPDMVFPDRCCPITALVHYHTGRELPLSSAMAAAQRIDLRPYDASVIINAADGKYGTGSHIEEHRVTVTRRRLLGILGWGV